MSAWWICVIGLVSIHLVKGLDKNGVNVETIQLSRRAVSYTSCGFLWLSRCSRYRTQYYTQLRCKSGYRSRGGTGCPYAICDGDINPTGACNIDYRTSHIIHRGRVQYSSGGTCSSPEQCTNCNDGFYASPARCRMCSNITNCDLETCTSPSNQKCTRCEGFVIDGPREYKAYIMTSNKKECIEACSWRSESTRCFPGTCANGYARNCGCSSGFSGKHCETIDAKPNMSDNILRLTAINGDTSEAPLNTSRGPPQASSWSKITSPSTVYFKFSAAFQKTKPTNHDFIEGYRVGIIGASATFITKRGGRTISTRYVTCGGVSRDNPDTDIYHCERSSTPGAIFPMPFQHRDRVEFSYEAKNGGFVIVSNKETKVSSTFYYNGATTTYTFFMGIDTVNPYHCTGTSACVNTMLAAPNLIKTPTINLRWSGWRDDDAGIDYFLIELYELHAVGDKLKVKSRLSDLSPNVSSYTTTTDITLPEVGIYSIILSAYDKANNHKSTRRILIYDGTSSVTTKVNTKLQITTASRATSQWQTASASPVSVSWTDRYINTQHHSNKWLLGADAVNELHSLYDDREGDRTVNPISNVNGIVRFTTSYKIDKKGGSTWTKSSPNDSEFASQALRQSQTIYPSLVDGDTLLFWVRAYDVMSNYKEENVSVHIDTSPPIIENLWLTRGDRVNISVHRIEELNEMTIEWVAFDKHSGLETVTWSVLDKYEGENIVHGTEHIRAQGETDDIEQCIREYAPAARGANCYCTPAMGCYHRHFQVKPRIVDSRQKHGGIFSDKAKGVHDSDYHLEITVRNHAQLTSTLQFKITIDASPPATGHVHDGLNGHPEIDYQDSLQLHAHWDGFFDRESGVKFYQYKFGPRCLTPSDFGLDDPSLTVNETTLTTASWMAPSPGKYHVTVVAYNRALEPSEPVCSDGVTIDTTPPSLSEVAVATARVVGGLVKTHGGSVWVIDAERRRYQISESNPGCRAKASNIDDEILSLFPQHHFKNKTSEDSANMDCSQYTALPSTFIGTFYMYRENNLMVNWTGSDSESGIYDYELGLMSDPSGEAAPDILSYSSTHHHAHYQGYHPALSEGQRFYIAVKATNKAGLSTTKVLGPVIVHTIAPVFTGKITVNLSGEYLLAQWNKDSFTDRESAYLTYQVAVGTKDMGTATLPFGDLKSGGNCALTSPPTCAAIAIKDLHWDLIHSHTYFVSVRVTNIVGLSVVVVSEPYVCQYRLPSRGVVVDLSPFGEESLFEITNLDDTDHQISTTSLSCRWYGFDNGLVSVMYEVGIGSEPLASDIEKMVDVGNKQTHIFTGLDLKENQKYFVTVEARNGAGNTTLSSDGVVIVKNDVDMSHIKIRDGPACTSFDNDTAKGNKDQECTRDTTYQLSSSIFAAHWRRQDSDRQKYPDVFWSLQQNLPHSDEKWHTVREYEHLGTSERILTGGVALEPGRTYRAVVKFCAVRVCSLPTHSDGVTVIPHPPKPGSISLKYETSGDKSLIHVTVDKFRDPDILLKSESYSVMDRYEWSLTDGSHHTRLLEAWKDVVAFGISDGGNKISFTIMLQKHLDFSKCRRLSIKGYNRVGVFSVVSADIKNCSAYDPAIVVPALVIDALGTSKGTDLGYSVGLQLNSAWGLPDADYTPYKNILSAVWPTLRHRNYSWALVSSDSTDTSHYKRENIMTVSDPCAIPGVIRCGRTENEYINVIFPPESYLKHGQRFYICIHADDMNVPFEKWTAQLSEVNVCSDGITVDLTAPTVGTVTVVGLNEDDVQVSTSEVSLRWRGFTDVEEEGAISHSSGISHYEVALGSVSGGQDLKFTNVGSVDHTTLHSLSLHSGTTVYASVRATDFVNKTSTVESSFLVDSTPPVLTGQQLEVEGYITSRFVHVCWVSVFTDKESGLKSYMVALGSKPGYDDISGYSFTDQTCTDVDTFNNVKEGHSYYISIKGYNRASLYTLVSSRPLTVSTTPPMTGHIYDGRKEMSAAGNKDKDFVTSPSEMGAHWEGFQNPNSIATVFKVKVGTCPGCDDKVQEFEYGTRKDITFHHTPFSPGMKYYTTVTACSAAGLCSSSTSDGVIIDSTAPLTGTVDDGTGDVDIQFQTSKTFVGCKWRGFYDIESGLDHYEWRVGTTPGGEEILTAKSAALEEIAFHTLPRERQLPVGQRIYITVRAYNKAGTISEVTTNGFIIDDSPPTAVTSPLLTPGFASSVSMTTISRTTLSVQWEFRDQESSIDRQYLSIASHELGEFNRTTVVVPSFIRQFVFTGLDLHDGSKYKVKVTACNMAGLCSSDVTQDIQVDSSKPKSGTFAVETAHAADLSRHQFGGMTWTATSLKLSWLGFSDLHFSVDHYIVSVGSQPFGTDLNKDGIQAHVTHNDSGVDKGDEGIVQTTTIVTENLKENTHVYVTIWAVNGVGLKSDPYYAQLTLESDQMLWLVRRCQPYNCEGHCVCAVQDGACHTNESCVALENGGVNSIVTVTDVIDLTFRSNVTDVDFSPLDSVMAATWSVTTSQGLPVQRYEYSIGDCDEPIPYGVFDAVSERVWFDAGRETSAIMSLPKGKYLTSGARYCFFVRAWYDASNYSIFKSDGVTIDVSAPSVDTKSGFSVKECRDQHGIKDIDYQIDTDKVFINWENKFHHRHGGISKYKVYISNKPGGHSIHESKDLTTTKYTATGLSLQPNTVYYSSVLVYNKAGLVSWAYSDGVQVDVLPPVAGVVHDGQGIHDVDFQSSPTEIAASWYGFSDFDSSIIKYHWCVGRVNDTIDCSILDWQDVGLHTSASRIIPPVASGTRLWNKVFAVDAVSHRSLVAVSDGLLIDTSPSEPWSLACLRENIIENPSFELMKVDLNQSLCSFRQPVSWDVKSDSCVNTTLSRLAQHGQTYIILSGSISQTLANLIPGNIYRIRLHTAYPETVEDYKIMDGFVVVDEERFDFKLDPSMCKETCTKSSHTVIMWNTHTYFFTATRERARLSISTSSRFMEVAIDQLSCQMVAYVTQGRDNFVFLSHLSSIHVSWHFNDTASPIREYKWAIGLAKGGTQLQDFRGVGRNTEGTFSGHRLVHKSSLFVTVMATNAAGLNSLLYSDPVVVDLTPPVFQYVHDGLSGDVDFIAADKLSANWIVTDEESGISHCDWAAGSAKSQIDLKGFMRVPSGQSFATYNLSEQMTSTRMKVFSTIRCFNKAGLVSVATSDGVEAVDDSEKITISGFETLEESTSVFWDRGQCHTDPKTLRFKWDGTQSGNIQATVVHVEGGSLIYQNEVPTVFPYTLCKLSGLWLTNLTSYNITLKSLNYLDQFGEEAKLSIHMHGESPSLNKGALIKMSRSTEGKITLSWNGLFFSPWKDLDYEIDVGTVAGGADIVDRHLTEGDKLELTLAPVHRAAKHIFVSVTAIDPCCITNHYSQRMDIP